MTRLRPLNLALLAACSVLAALALAPAAMADDSQIKISEVYSDGLPAGKDDFIEFQLAAPAQQFDPGAVFRLYSPNGAATISFAFPAATILADSQRTVLLGFNTNPNVDFAVASGLNPPPIAGAACLLDPGGLTAVDCVSWGNFTGVVPSAAPPIQVTLPNNQSLVRKISSGCPTLLEPGDDTNNSSADFQLSGLTPRNNLSLPTETACPVPAAPKKKKCKKKKKKGKKKLLADAAKKKKCKKKKK
jgi:hypothetical protein